MYPLPTSFFLFVLLVLGDLVVLGVLVVHNVILIVLVVLGSIVVLVVVFSLLCNSDTASTFIEE